MKSLREKRIGETKINKQGKTMKIVEYKTANDLIVKFEDGSIVHSDYETFSKGSTLCFSERNNEVNYNSQGIKMIIKEYINSSNIIVEFLDGYTVRCAYKEFKNGNIKHPFKPSLYNVGTVGTITTHINKKPIKEYKLWNSMLSRCYNENELKRHPTYKDCKVCEEWLYFPNFIEWCHSQDNWNLVVNSDNYNLDKDIIHKNNKTYAPENCCFVPQNVNKLFTKTNSLRGDLPIGVSSIKNSNKYRARCQNPFGKMYEKNFNTIETAFEYYKTIKEDIIKQVAKIEYDNNHITKQCYEAMLTYSVEITD